MNMRDPLMYRINVPHPPHRHKWCIYPTYDFAHGQCDSIERITHSICTLEFEVHRPLYDWFSNSWGLFSSHQIEFARLNLNYTVMSKRKLLSLCTKNIVAVGTTRACPRLSEEYGGEAIYPKRFALSV